MNISISNDQIQMQISTLGAQPNSIVYQGIQYLWQGTEDTWPEHAPVLFPVVGRCLNNQIEVNGRRYPMPQHGFAKDMEFTIAEKGEDFVTFLLASNEETLKMYPYSFRFYVSYQLKGKKIITSFRIENISHQEMFFGIGGHPGYCCPLNGEGDFTDWVLAFNEDVPLYSIPVTPEGVIRAPQNDEQKIRIDHKKGIVPLKKELFIPDAMIFENLKSKTVTIRHKNQEKGVQVDFSEFDTLAIWTLTPENAQYVCIEPWHGMAHVDGESYALKEKKGIQSLLPEQSRIYAFTTELL